jgi:predicted alpha/beta-hydrolase family hydrolase
VLRVEVHEVGTPLGPARLHVHLPVGAGAARPEGTLVLGHGAGGGIEAADLAAVTGRMADAGWRVVLVEQPWRVAGKKVAPAPARLDLGWRAALAGLAALDAGHGPSAVAALTGQGEAAPAIGGRPLVVGGRSASARVACRTAVGTGADAVICLSFPLHPPGKPERSRADELAGAGIPVLVVQGERDPFGRPEEVRVAVPGVEVAAVPGDHGLALGAVRAADAVLCWLASRRPRAVSGRGRGGRTPTSSPRPARP